MQFSNKTDRMSRKKPLKSQWELPTNKTGKPAHRQGKQDKRQQLDEEIYA